MALLSTFTAVAQTDMSAAQRFSSDSLYKHVYNNTISMTWCKDNPKTFYFSREDAAGRHWYASNTKNWKVRLMLDNDKFAEQMKEYRPSIDAENIYLSGIKFSGKDNFIFEQGDNILQYNMATNKLTKIGEREKKENKYRSNKYYYRRYSKDSLYYTNAVGHDLYLYNIEKRDSTRITHDGESLYSYASSGDNFDNRIKKSDIGSAIGCWIGNSHKYFMVREDKREIDTLSLVNSLATPRPKLKSYLFPMAGDKGISRYSTYIMDGNTGEIKELECAKFLDQKIETPRFGNIKQGDNCVYFLRRNRTCDSVELCSVNASEDRINLLISEKYEPHLNEQLFNYHIINDDILWWSDRSGKGQIFRYDLKGKCLNEITPKGIVAGEIVRIDTLEKRIVFAGYGGEEGINPHYKLLYGVDFNGRNFHLLTPRNGNHSISFSPNGEYIVDNSSRMDSAPIHSIYDRRGRLKLELGRCDVSEIHKLGWREPKVVKVKAADGKTDLYGVVYTPFGAKEGDKFPIISNVYPGPHDDLVPQSFHLDDNYNMTLSQLGFVVIQFSYRGGCPYRGREYYAHGHHNLRDYALADDKATIKQIGEMFPCADTTRVGIYGHSGGGFMTTAAMLTSPDFYKVGFAASGNHDNNIYTQWWGETFHGGKWVEKDGKMEFECKIPTNIELAGNLKGHLMLVTGDMDNNVHPASTYRMANALIKKGKRFDMLVIPGADHGLGDKYYINLIRNYFVEHLKGEPQENINIIPNK